MAYKIDTTDLSVFGLAAPQQERIALEGIFSLPPRKGDTERNWGTQIEPFVEAGDMDFDGRSLTLNVWINGSPADYNSRLAAFKAACVACRSLNAGYATFPVLLREGVTVKEYLRAGRAIASATFWQQAVDFPALTTPATGGTDSWLLDGYNLKNDFGIRVAVRKDNNNVGKRIEVGTTLPYSQTRYRERADLILQCYLRGNGFADMYGKITQFHALCASPGLRTLTLPDGSSCTGYVKDGFTVRADHSTKLSFDFKLRVI